jgi:TonB family protein
MKKCIRLSSKYAYLTFFLAVLITHFLLLSSWPRWDDLVFHPTGPPVENKNSHPRVLSPLRLQIVQSEETESQDRPDEAQFFSDKNRKFLRQTLAKKVEIFKSSSSTAVEEKKENKKISLSDLGAYSKNHHPLQAAALEKKTSSKKMARSQVESSTNDFVENVPLGSLTNLNTVEYVYYGYYHRIRQKLEQFWGRSLTDMARSFIGQGRRIATGDHLVTSLVITLNPLGEITSILIKGSSGIRELDHAAVDSFNKAGPFPNPPKGLIHNGQVSIEWGFIVNPS